MTFELPKLPYSKDALAPHISRETLDFHHGKHHATYVQKLNDLVKKSEFVNASLEEIILHVGSGPLFENAAQHWNHSFYWNCLTPESPRPKNVLTEAIKASFGSLANFKSQFTEAAVNHFGSGWAWLMMDDKGIKIETTHDADLPLAHGATALLTCDVWEHAYYIDYHNARSEYLKHFWNIVNWRFVEENYNRALSLHSNRKTKS
jgi:superoxide dismutase, Fe-Mn family